MGDRAVLLLFGAPERVTPVDPEYPARGRPGGLPPTKYVETHKGNQGLVDFDLQELPPI